MVHLYAARDFVWFGSFVVSKYFRTPRGKPSNTEGCEPGANMFPKKQEIVR